LGRERFYNGETFYGGYFNKGEAYQIHDYFSPGGVFMGETF